MVGLLDKHLVVLFLLFQILFLFYYLLFVCIINFYFKMGTRAPVLLSSENLVAFPPQFVDIALVFPGIDNYYGED